MNRALRLTVPVAFALLAVACGSPRVEAPAGGLTTDLSGQPEAGAAPGVWEGVAFDPGQVTVALDLAANGDLHTLDVDAALDSRAAQAIVATRPHTMAALAATDWVGPTALLKIRAFLPAWQERRNAVETYDGVSFSHLEAARALGAANGATADALGAAGIHAPQSTTIVGGRPWGSLAAVAAHAGIGPATVGHLKSLGASFPDASPWWLDAAGSAADDAAARDALGSDASLAASIGALLADETAEPSWADATAAHAIDRMQHGIDDYALFAIGRTYTGAPAASADVSAFGDGEKATALADYPAGLMRFVPHATEAEQLARAKIAIVHYFEYTLIESPAWSEIGLPWSDVSARVTADAAAFDHGPAYQVFPQYQGLDQTVFAGDVDGLHTEVTVDGLGRVTHVLIEID